MNEQETRKIVDKHLRLMRWALQLQDWGMNISYEDKESPAEANVKPDYEIASINIDPAKHNTKEEVLRDLRHEMIHILAAPFILYEQLVDECVDDKNRRVLRRYFTYALEQHCLAIENLLDHGLHLPVEKMLQRTKRKLKEWSL